jgi:hypothetical protein
MSSNPLIERSEGNGPVYRLMFRDGQLIGREQLPPLAPVLIPMVIPTIRPKRYVGNRPGRRRKATSHNL